MKATGYEGETELTSEQALWPFHLGVRGAVSPTADTLTGTSTATSSTTMTDSGATWTANELVGAAVSCGGKTGTVTANTSTQVTVASWTGGTPASVSAYTITLLSYLWNHTPQLTTAAGKTVDTASCEMAYSDGATNQQLITSGYNDCESFKINGAFNKEYRMGMKLNGRANQASAPTSSLSAYSTLSALPFNLTKVTIDTTWAGLGNTQLLTILRSLNFECSTGILPDFTGDNRSDLDRTGRKFNPLSAKLSLALELNATTASQLTNYRSNSIVFVQFDCLGAKITGANGYRHMVRVAGCYRFVNEPGKSDDGQQGIRTLELEACLDTTSSKILDFWARNTLSAVA
jgi:hypothetical protein